MYKILQNLISPATLSGHYRPTPSEIFELVKQYSYICIGASEYCNFGDTLKATIRDHLVCGVEDDAIQKRLLAELKLTIQLRKHAHSVSG